MEIILDADVVIKGERGEFDLPVWLASHRRDDFAIAAITVAELWHGVERASSTHRHYREQYIRAVLDAFPILPYTEQVAYLHARIWAALESSGQTISPYDLLVAATALDRDSAVATYNQRHYSRIQSLKIIQPGS